MMDDEDKTERAINRGQRARELMEDELLSEAFASLEAQYIQAWRTAPARDTIMREKLWLAVNQVGKLKDHLAKVLAGGRLAQADLRMREAQRRRA